MAAEADVESSYTNPVPGLSDIIPHGGILHVHPDGSGYTYAYGPKGVSGLLHNYYALVCAVFASIGGLTFGYDQGVIANVLVMKDFVERWHLSAWETGLMSTSSSYSYAFSGR